MATLILKSPLAGWALPLEEVPDPVFAQRMAGDGMAIEPTGNVLHAPCAGEVVSIAGSRHALTLRSDGGAEIILHVGIDTVALAGEGFEALVRAGERVACSQPLLRFDLDFVARRAPSLATPVLLAGGGRLLRCVAPQRLQVGDELMEIELDAASEVAVDRAPDWSPARQREFVVGHEHGLHARPAAQLAAALRPLDAQVRLQAHGRSANARSAISVMALGARCGDVVQASATGADADAALEAMALVLASNAGAATRESDWEHEAATPAEGELRGVIACRGLAVGPAAFLHPPRRELIEHAEDPARERNRLQDAIAAVQSRLQALLADRGGPQGEILEAHRELVQDPELLAQAQRHIAGGSSAGHAWRLALGAAARALASLDDPRLRERIADLQDIENQVLDALEGREAAGGAQLPDGAILLADELLPSQLIGLEHARLAGICTARGGPTSHVAIIAAALGIPALVAAGPGVLTIAAGAMLLLDAEQGCLRLAPSSAELSRARKVLADRRTRQAEDLAAAGDPARTRDGVHIHVGANLGAVDEAATAVARGADGCGLLRTEFLFLQRRSPPGEDEQFEHYREFSEALAPRPLTIRTMDVGGDKPIPYLPQPAEENPALGLRGLRASLARPALLRTQFRAILRLREPGRCRVLLPMVTDLGDLQAARTMLRECADELGIAELPRLGAMVETPASALLAGQLVDAADFLSIGSNDLSQYVLAMDRAHPLLAARLDALHPAVLQLVASVARVGDARGRDVAVCGGLASDADAIALLLGLGIRELSAVPAMVPAIKRIVRGLDLQACRALAAQALELNDASAVRALVAGWTDANANAETGLEKAR